MNDLRAEDLSPEQRRVVDAALAAKSRPTATALHGEYAFYSPARRGVGVAGWIDVEGVGLVALSYDETAARADWSRRCRAAAQEREEKEVQARERGRKEQQAARSLAPAANAAAAQESQPRAEREELESLRARVRSHEEARSAERARPREDPRPCVDEREPQYRYGHYGDEDYRVYYQTGMD